MAGQDHVIDSLSANLPAELVELPQWVAWRSEIRDGKATKVPLDPHTGRYASTNKPATWGTYAEALAFASKARCAGVGFVLTRDGPFTFVDLDHCRDSETGTVEPWAVEIVDQLRSYSEGSVSGTGVHILLRAKAPGPGRRRGRVELYDRGRFFVMTGDHLPSTPTTIEKRQLELNVLYAQIFGEADNSHQGAQGSDPPEPTNMADVQLLERAHNAKNGDRFRALWEGDWRWGGYGSQSEADLAFACMLAFWSGCDSTQIDRIFRSSGLNRPKWEQRHYGDGRTYGQATIERAIRHTRETYSEPAVPVHVARPRADSQPESRTTPADESSEDTEDSEEPEYPKARGRYTIHQAAEAMQILPPIDWIVEGLFAADSVSLIVGEGGSKKTWLLLDCAVAVARGTDWLGMPVKPGNVLVIDEESGDRRVKRRLRQLMRVHEVGRELPLYWTTLEQFNLRESIEVGYLGMLFDEVQPQLVVIDALADIMPGGDENAVKDVQPVFQALRLLANRYECAIVVIHHCNKGGRYRGSTAMKGAVELMLMVESKKDSPLIELVSDKTRDTDEVSLSVHVVFDQQRERVEFTRVDLPDCTADSLTKTQQAVLAYVRQNGPVPVRDVMDHVPGCAPGTARSAVYFLAGKEFLRRTNGSSQGQAIYAATDKT